MFDFIRTHQRLMQLVLLVLILPSFVLIGVSGYTNYVSGDEELVKVGKSAITLQEFDQARRNQLQQFQQNSQGSLDPSVLDNPEVRRALLESLVERRLLADAATEQRFSVSDAALRQTIASMPQLQVNGQFSPERYNEVLASAGLTTRDFEQSQRAELALDRVLGPVAQTASVPGSVVHQLERALTEQRTVRLLVFPAADYEQEVSISDADIQAWYDKNKQTLQLPEQVSAQYLLLDEAAAMAKAAAPTEEALRAYYEQNKARYVQPARVNVSHIQVNVASGATEEQRKQAQAKAEEIAKQAKASPGSFAELAQQQSEDAGTAKEGGKLGWITRGSWPESLEKAVFGLAQGDVSGAVEGPGGFHVFQVNEIQPEKGESFQEARAKIESEVRRQLAADRFAEMATQLTSLVYDNPESLQPAAEALGLDIKSASGITRDQLLASDLVGANAASASEDGALLDDARVRLALFTPQVYAEKQNSGVIEISPDTMMVVRVGAVTPAHVPELSKVADQIRERLKTERALEAARKAGEERLAQLEKQDAPEALEGFGTPQTISRMDPQGVAKPAADAAFSVATESLPEYTGVSGPQGYVVIRVESAKEGEAGNAMLAGLPAELSQAWGRAEEQAVLKAMRAQADVKMLPEAEAALSGQSVGQE